MALASFPGIGGGNDVGSPVSENEKGHVRKTRNVFVVAIAFWCALLLTTADAEQGPAKGGVTATSIFFRIDVPGTVEDARTSLVSALENNNFAIINTLNVQQGLKGRGISSEPLLLVEFINLTEAYKVTESNRSFETFAPLRAALFQDRGKVEIIVLRPRYIEGVLVGSGLSDDARAVLERFDRQIAGILEDVASGGF